MQFFYRYPVGEIAVNFQQWRIYADTSEALRRSSSDVFGYRVDVPSRHSRQSVAGRRDARIASALSARLLPHRRGASVFTCDLCKEEKKSHQPPRENSREDSSTRDLSFSSDWRTSGEKSALRKCVTAIVAYAVHTDGLYLKILLRQWSVILS